MDAVLEQLCLTIFHTHHSSCANVTPSSLNIYTIGQVLELRERRLDHEETLAEVQKATDEHKRNLDRQV